MNLVFDYDGTIHDSIVVYEPAFRYAIDRLEQNGLVSPTHFTTEDIAYWIGFSAQDMWDCFMPDLSREAKESCSQLIGDTMMELIGAGRARLYPYALEVLKSLHAAGHRLLFLSNCSRSYLDAHRKSFPLDEHFSAFYCAEEFAWQPKPQIFTHIKAQQNSEEPYVIIGDRATDIAIATTHGCQSIACVYGYGREGELDGADYFAAEFKEVQDIVESLGVPQKR